MKGLHCLVLSQFEIKLNHPSFVRAGCGTKTQSCTEAVSVIHREHSVTVV